MAVSDKDQARARLTEARNALDDDLATLTDRLPAAAVVAQAGAAGGTGLALLGLAAKQLQKKLAQRSEEKALTREAEIQARAIAAAISAAGLHAGHGGHGGHHADHADHDDHDAPAPRPSAPRRPASAPAPAADDDDGGPPWGIILLLAGLAAAVIALVTGAKDDADLWSTPEA